MALSGGDLTNARTSGHRTSVYLSIVPQTTVATALVNQTSFSHTIAQLTVDNTANWTDAKAGMTVWLGTTSNSHDIGVYRVRKTPTSTILYINETSQGDFGAIPHGTLQIWDNNLYVTIKEDYNIWAVASRISGTTFYKDFDTAYSNQNQTTPPAVLNIGAHVAAFVDTTTNVITVSKTATIDPFLSETITTVLWDIDDGTYTSGSSSTASITATFPAGFRVVTCQVTLSTGAVVNSERMVFAHDTSSNAPHEIASIQSDRRNRTGRTANLTIKDDAPSTSIPAGAMCIVWEESTWGGGNDISSAAKQFVGWVTERNMTQAPGQVDTSITIQSGYQLMQELVAYSQQVSIAATPATWQEVVSSLANPNFFAFYLLYWHSTLARLFDVSLNSDFDSSLFRVWMVTFGSIPSQMAQIFERISAWLGQGSDGTLYVAKQFAMMSTSERAAVTNIMTLTSQDMAKIDISPHIRAKISRIEGSAFAYDSGGDTITPYLSHAPGSAGGQGGQIASLENMLVASQSDLNLITAHKFAQLSNPYSRITVEIDRNYDFFEPARGDVVGVDVSGVSDWTEDFTTFDAQILEVAKTYLGGGNATITLVVERESDGTNAPGETVPVPVSDDIPNYGDGGDDIIWIDIDSWDPADWDDFDLLEPPPTGTGAPTTAYRLIAAADAGLAVAVSKTSPVWTVLDTPATNYSIKYYVVSPFSAYLTTDPYAGALRIYELHFSNLNNDTKVIYSSDALATSPVFTTQDTLDGQYIVIRPLRGLDNAIVGYGREPIAGSEDYYIGDPVGTIDIDHPAVDPWNEVKEELLIPVGGSDSKLYGLEYTVFNHDTVNSTSSFPLARKTAASSPSLFFDTSTNHANRAYLFCDSDPKAVLYDSSVHSWIQWTDGTGYRSVNVAIYAAWSVRGTYEDFPTIIIRPIYYGDNNPRKKVFYSADNGATISEITIGSGSVNIGGMDTDDHNIGVILASAENRIYYSTSYGGAMSLASGADVTPTWHNCVRIPYYKVSAPTTLNDDTTSLEFVFATHGKIADDTTIWWATIDTSSGTITNGADITPIIAGITYRVVDNPDGLEILGSNPRYMRAIAQDADDPAADWVVIETTNGGAWWTVGGNYNGKTVYHTGTSSLWLSGVDGIRFSSDGGDTFSDRDGDFETTVDATPIYTGVRTL